MSKSMMIRARIEPSLKESAESIFKELGLNATQAITLFYRQVELHQGLPFSVSLPNETTQAVLDAAQKGEGLIQADNGDELLDALGIK